MNGHLGGHFYSSKLCGTKEISLSLQTICVEGTVYWGVSSQTDSTPNKTASQKTFNPLNPPRWCALSMDIVKKYNLQFGDTILVHSNSPTSHNINGYWVFEDVMNIRWKNKIDFLVAPGIIDRYYDLSITFKSNSIYTLFYFIDKKQA